MLQDDADFRKEAVLQSVKDFFVFRKMYFPQWEHVILVCKSWLLAPALRRFLDSNLNIIAFQNLFEIDETDEESNGFMKWVFPGHDSIDEQLPERTLFVERGKGWCSQRTLEGVRIKLKSPPCKIFLHGGAPAKESG